MMLLWLHPQVARRDCRQCQLYQYNERTGEVEQWRGKPLRRVAGQPPPCRTQKGCPRGTPEQQQKLTVKNERALDHYLRCRATGRFPDDPLVARNAAIIRSVEDELRRRRTEELHSLITAVVERHAY